MPYSVITVSLGIILTKKIEQVLTAGLVRETYSEQMDVVNL